MPQIVLGARSAAQGVDAAADLDAMFGELFARIAPVVGLYTPTLTAVSNVAVATANANVIFLRFGGYVFVSGTLQLDPTAASVSTTLGISLPVASNLGSFTQLAGSATRTSGVIAPLGAGITGDSANERANLTFQNDTDVADRTWSFYFSYPVI